jgi:tRNA(fMet)-specific endonuclease VapC
MFALDTNALIHFFKGAGRCSSGCWRRRQPRSQSPRSSSTNWRSASSSPRNHPGAERSLDALLAVVSVLCLNAEAAKRAAELNDALRRKGAVIGPMDTLIAGTAIAHRTTLVTHNTAEFRRVPGLKIVDWY